MTVTAQQQALYNMKNQQNSDRSLNKQWSSVKNIQVCRKSTENLGISIVCGKVNFHTAYSESIESTSGIFIKSILPNSTAGNIGLFQLYGGIAERMGQRLVIDSLSQKKPVKPNTPCKTFFLLP